MTDEEAVARWPKRLRIDPLLGLMQQCTWCEEWWMATLDLFVAQPSGRLGLHSHCKACIYGRRNSGRGRLRDEAVT